MKIILLGYMGSGKSTIAKKLSEVLNIDAIDLDDYIENQEKLSIRDIFNQKGEIYFRKKESDYLSELLNNENNFILALGGGTPCYANNMTKIIEKSTSIYLKGSISNLVNRLKGEKEKRPLIKDLDDADLAEFIAKHLFERRNFYEKSQYTINIDDKSVEEISKEIIDLI